MSHKYVLLYHSAPFHTAEEIKQFDTSYKKDGKVISTPEALIYKSKGESIQYPKAEIRYHYVLAPTASTCEILLGRSLDKPGGACKIKAINKQSVQICILGDFNESNPSRETLNTLFILTRGLCADKKISPKHILPGRYFDKDIDSPGLLFNTKRFVREYFEVRA